MAGKSSDIRAGRAFVELFTKNEKLVAGLNAGAARLKAFGASVAAIGAKTMGVGLAIGAGFLAAAKTFADAGSDLLDMSQRTGVSVEALSELGYAAGQSGASIEDLEKSLRFMGKAITGADDESKKAQESLARLGLTAGLLEGMSPEAQFELIADRLAGIQDPGEKATRTLAIFGKGGAALLPLMNDGASGIRNLREEARRLGLTMSTEDATNAERFGDAISAVTATAKRAVVLIGSALAPTLEKVANWLSETASQAGFFIKENQGLVRIIGAGVVGLTALGLALTILGPAITIVGYGIGTVALGLKLVLFYAAMMKSMVMLMLTPLGALLKIADFFLTNLVVKAATGTGALATLGQGFWTIAGIAKTTWGGVIDMMAAGDLEGAAQLAWVGIKTAWGTGIEYLSMAWSQFASTFVDTFIGPVSTIIDAFSTVWTFLQETFISVVGIIGEAWTNLTSSIGSQTREVSGAVQAEVGIMESVWSFLARTINAFWVGLKVTFLTVVNGLASAWDYFCHGLKVAFNEFVGFFQRAWARVKNIFNPSEARRQVQAINAEIAASNAQSREGLEARNRARGREIADALDTGVAVDDDITRTTQQRANQLAEEIVMRRTAREAATAKSQAKIRAMQEELNRLREVARQKALEAKGPTSDPGTRRAEGRSDLSKAKVEAKGTFGAFALWGLGSSSVTERIARATERTAINTARSSTPPPRSTTPPPGWAELIARTATPPGELSPRGTMAPPEGWADLIARTVTPLQEVSLPRTTTPPPGWAELIDRTALPQMQEGPLAGNQPNPGMSFTNFSQIDLSPANWEARMNPRPTAFKDAMAEGTTTGSGKGGGTVALSKDAESKLEAIARNTAKFAKPAYT